MVSRFYSDGLTFDFFVPSSCGCTFCEMKAVKAIRHRLFRRVKFLPLSKCRSRQGRIRFALFLLCFRRSYFSETMGKGWGGLKQSLEDVIHFVAHVD